MNHNRFEILHSMKYPIKSKYQATFQLGHMRVFPLMKRCDREMVLKELFERWI